MGSLRIHLIVAARPNFMKIAPLYHALGKTAWAKRTLIHTGQHYDPAMSEMFLRELGLPQPDASLDIGGGSHAEQTGRCMMAYEAFCRSHPPDLAVVAGDVNATMACALAAVKCGVAVAHLEAGLRSGDRTMPEEINRIVTDHVCDILWTTCDEADANLRREGLPPEKIDRVGNIMMDAFELLRGQIAQRNTADRLGMAAGGYGVVTLHRPATVDDRGVLQQTVEALVEQARRLPMVFPVHPRTRRRLEEFGLWPALSRTPGLRLTEPLGYVDFMSLMRSALCVITDSGGVQEETTYLRIPCITLRSSTERPVTLTQGTNRLAKIGELSALLESIRAGRWPQGASPQDWDGHAAERVTACIARRMGMAGA